VNECFKRVKPGDWFCNYADGFQSGSSPENRILVTHVANPIAGNQPQGIEHPVVIQKLRKCGQSLIRTMLPLSFSQHHKLTTACFTFRLYFLNWCFEIASRLYCVRSQNICLHLNNYKYFN